MDSYRQNLVERIYDSVEFPNSAISVYCSLYHAMANAMNMETQMFNEFFPQWIDPMNENYKLNEQICTDFNTHILESCNLQLLETIANDIEDNQHYDEGYDSY